MLLFALNGKMYLVIDSNINRLWKSCRLLRQRHHREIAKYSKDENFKKDLSKYLELIQYDEQQVYEELISKCKIK